MNQYLIRRVHPDDLPAILGIEQTSFHADAYSAADFCQYYCSDRELFLVGHTGHGLHGYIIGRTSGERAKITSLAVHPQYRRAQLGTQLVLSLFSSLQARAVEVVDLEVRPTNRGALAFWARHGFALAGRIPDYYADGADALRMRRYITL